MSDEETVFERDLSLAQVADMIGWSRKQLKAVWKDIPTAYVTEGGRHKVQPSGVRRWLEERGQR